MTDELDIALTAPLPAIEDGGFSRRVTARVARAQQWRAAFQIAAFAAATGIALTFVSLDTLSRAVETVTWNLGSSLAVAVAFAALVLSNHLAQMTSDRLG
jgi:uncharacterized membrane protein YcfT